MTNFRTIDMMFLDDLFEIGGRIRSEFLFTAFGRGKRIICMVGLDLYEVINRELPLNQALDSKARRVAETGRPFARVRDLFPG